MSKINHILEGKYENATIKDYGDIAYVNGDPLSKYTVDSYQVIDETNKDQYSIWKGALGVALLGGIGAVAGIGGKNKKEYLVALNWKDGEKSLMYIDEDCYKAFVRGMF